MPAICDAYDAFHGDTATHGEEEPDSQPAEESQTANTGNTAENGEDEPEVVSSGMCDNKNDQKNAEDAAKAVVELVETLQHFNVDYRECHKLICSGNFITIAPQPKRQCLTC